MKAEKIKSLLWYSDTVSGEKVKTLVTEAVKELSELERLAEIGKAVEYFEIPLDIPIAWDEDLKPYKYNVCSSINELLEAYRKAVE